MALLTPGPIFAQTKEPSFERKLLNDNIVISEWLDGMAEGLDVFLAGEQFTKKRNETKFTITTSLFYDELNQFNDATSFDLNLRLPNVEEYWMLTFSSYDDTDDRLLTQNQFRTNPRQREYGARLGFFKKLGNVRTSFRPRISFSEKPKISHSLVFESIAEKTGGYRVNPKLEFYGDADRGVGTFQALNFNFSLAKKWGLTIVNEGDYSDRTHTYLITHGLSLGQTITFATNLAYGIYFNFTNQPNHQLTEYIVSLSLNHMVYKNILDFEFIPYFNFGQARDYTGYYGGIFNIRLNF